MSAHTSRLEIARDCYRAYETGDRNLLERHLSHDFTFSSPVDKRIDRSAYFARCWPNHEHLRAFRFLRVVEGGDDVFVIYESTRDDGTRFRNTEVLTFRGDEIRGVEVYFGWDLDRR